MKVVVLGGSAQSTPALFEYLASRSDIPKLDVHLVGRDPIHLAAVARASRMMSDRGDVSIAVSGMQDCRRALESAEVVLIQIRFGGYSGRHFDESFPLSYGMCGDESVGLGGLAAGWRAWPGLAPLLNLTRSVCPGALVVIFSSPVSLLVRIARSVFPDLRSYGLCELPWVTLQHIAATVGGPVEALDFDYIGVNHIGWFYRLAHGRTDLLAAYSLEQDRVGIFPSGVLCRDISAAPTKYLRLHYDYKSALHHQFSSSQSRAQVLERISQENYKTFLYDETHDIRRALRRRPSPWYAEAVGPFLLGLAGADEPESFFLSCQNGALYDQFESQDCLEVPHVVRGRAIIPRKPVCRPPTQILRTLAAFVEYERRAARAILNRDTEMLGDALSIHPWVGKRADIANIVAEITSASAIEERVATI